MRVYLLISLLMLLNVASCSNADNKIISQFTDTSNNYSIEDFEKFGFKKGEKYDNSNLPYSKEIYWGFWKDNSADEGSARFQSLGKSVGGMREFEIRFYQSHKEALDNGLEYVENVTGPNAVLTKKESLWPEGIRNRRTSGGPDGSPLPKFGGYVVYGNFILLCEGVNQEQSIQSCSNFINNLEEKK